MKFNVDCQHYLGGRPCKCNRLCEDCPDYETDGPRVLIIKTGAMGDVLRTTSLLPALYRGGSGARIAWLTAPEAAPLLIGNPLVHEIIPFDHAAYPSLAPRKFDLLISLDKEPGPAGMAEIINAKRKAGAGLSPCGAAYPLNAEAEYYFALGLSDELKFRQNKKTYHELIAEAAGLEYNGERPVLNLASMEIEYGMEVLKRSGWDGSQPVVGINTGSGTGFANKMLSAAAILDVIDIISSATKGVFIALLGGPLERDKNNHIARASNLRAVDTGCNHSLRGFAGIVNHCGAVLSGDTLALHIAVALGRKVAALFGPTVDVEIDLFGNGVKLTGNTQCRPCYKQNCDIAPTCMDALRLEQVADAVVKLLEQEKIIK